MRVVTNKRSKKIKMTMGQQIQMHERSMRQALYDIGGIAKNEVRRLLATGRRTGRLYRYGGRTIQASAPGEVPAKRSGRLIKSSNYRVSSSGQMIFGESAPYAGYLEDGRRGMAARPHLILAINNTQQQAIELFYRRFNNERKRAQQNV